MSDQNAAPAGGGEAKNSSAVADAPAFDSIEDAADLLTEVEDGEEEDSEGAEGAQEKPANPAEDDPDDSGDLDDDEDGEADDEDDDEDEDEGGFVKGEAKTRLDDGTIVTVGELKKNTEKARMFDQLSPQLDMTMRNLQAREQYFYQREQAVEFFEYQLQALAPQEPDPSLLDEDPMEYQEQKARYDLAYAQFAEQYQYLEAYKQQEQEERSRQRQQAVQWHTEQVFQKRPEMRDPTKAQEYGAKISRYLQSKGFGPDDWSNAYDHRLYDIVDDAMKYAEFEAGRRGKTEKAAAAARPQKTAPRPNKRVAASEKQMKRLQAQLKKVNSIDEISDLATSLELDF